MRTSDLVRWLNTDMLGLVLKVKKDRRYRDTQVLVYWGPNTKHWAPTWAVSINHLSLVSETR